MILINRIKNIMSINKSAIYSIVGTFFRFASAPLIMLAMSKSMSLEEQGYYYAFISVAAIQWIFELGVSTCLVQSLAAIKQKNIAKKYMEIGLCFYVFSSLMVFIFLNIYALSVFEIAEASFWFLAWFFYAITISANLFLNYFLIVSEGVGDSEFVYLTRLKSSVAYSATLLIAIYFGYGLWSLFFAQLAQFFVTSYSIRKISEIIFIPHRRNLKKYKSIVRKMWRFQYKVSLVWIFGYLYWNLINIYIFKTNGPVLSGQFGMVNSIFTALAVAMSAILFTKRSNIGYKISEGFILWSYTYFKKIYIVIAIGYITLSSLFFIVIKSGLFDNVLNRMLSIDLMILFSIMRLFMMLYDLILIYMRMFNDEPLYILTLCNYVLFPLSFILVLEYFDIMMSFYIAIFVQVVFLYIGFSKLNNYISDKQVFNI